MAQWHQDGYTQAWNFAAKAHNGQLVPGTDWPYLTHIGNVAMEVMSALALSPDIRQPDLALQCALLHDSLEDTAATYEQLRETFGSEVAEGVLALSKDASLATKAEKMADSLRRIRTQPKEVWMVKLGDRITNLQRPPAHWNPVKIKNYWLEAQLILEALGEANVLLAERLAGKIDEYRGYF